MTGGGGGNPVGVIALSAGQCEKRIAALSQLLAKAFEGRCGALRLHSFRHSGAWFSETHFEGRPGFDLPFEPESLLWSQTLLAKTAQFRHACGYYRRGVAKYERLIRGGVAVPAVTLILRERFGREGFKGFDLHLEDGNHRAEAALRAGLEYLPAKVAIHHGLAHRLLEAASSHAKMDITVEREKEGEEHGSARAEVFQDDLRGGSALGGLFNGARSGKPRCPA